jgi:hypothetical protein
MDTERTPKKKKVYVISAIWLAKNPVSLPLGQLSFWAATKELNK